MAIDRERLRARTQQGFQMPAVSEPEPEAAQRGVIRDTVTGVGAGVVGMGQALAGVGSMVPGADRVTQPAYQGLGNVRDWLIDQQSPAAQQARENVHGAWESGESFGDNLSSTLGAVGDNPYYLLPALGEAVGSLGAFGKTLKGVDAVSRRVPGLQRVANASAPAKVAGVAGAMGLGSAAGQIAEGSDDYLDRMYALPSAAVHAATAGVGARLGGALDPKTIAGRLAGARLPAAGGAPGAGQLALANQRAAVRYPAYAAIGATNEATQEFLQSGSDALFVNLGLGNEAWEGVGQAAVLGSISGGLGGGATGVFAGAADRKTQNLLRMEADRRATARREQAPADTAAPTENLDVVDSIIRTVIPENAREAVKQQWSGRKLDQDLTTSEGVAEFMDTLVVPRQRGESGPEFSPEQTQMRRQIVEHMLIRATQETGGNDYKQAQDFLKTVFGSDDVIKKLAGAHSPTSTDVLQNTKNLEAALSDASDMAGQRADKLKADLTAAREALSAIQGDGSEAADGGRREAARASEELRLTQEAQAAVRALQNRVKARRAGMEETNDAQQDARKQLRRELTAQLMTMQGANEGVAAGILEAADGAQAPDGGVALYDWLKDNTRISDPVAGRGKSKTSNDLTLAHQLMTMHMHQGGDQSRLALDLIADVFGEDGAPIVSMLQQAAQTRRAEDLQAVESIANAMATDAATLAQQTKRAKLPARHRKDLEQQHKQMQRRAAILSNLVMAYQIDIDRAADSAQRLDEALGSYDDIRAARQMPAVQTLEGELVDDAPPAQGRPQQGQLPPGQTRLLPAPPQRQLPSPDSMPSHVVLPDGTRIVMTEGEVRQINERLWSDENRSDPDLMAQYFYARIYDHLEAGKRVTRPAYRKAVEAASGIRPNRVSEAEFQQFRRMWNDDNTYPIPDTPPQLPFSDGGAVFVDSRGQAVPHDLGAIAQQAMAQTAQEVLVENMALRLANRIEIGDSSLLTSRGKLAKTLDTRRLRAALERSYEGGAVPELPPGVKLKDVWSRAREIANTKRQQAQEAAPAAQAQPAQEAPAAQAQPAQEAPVAPEAPRTAEQLVEAFATLPNSKALIANSGRLVAWPSVRRIADAHGVSRIADEDIADFRREWPAMRDAVEAQLERERAAQAQPAEKKSPPPAEDVSREPAPRPEAPLSRAEVDSFDMRRADVDGDFGSFGQDWDWGNSDVFNLANRIPEQPIAADEATAVVDTALQSMPAAPNVTVVANPDSASVPATAREVFAQARREGRLIKGFYHRGEIYIDPSMHDSPQDVLRTVYHEVVGHHGLRGALGDQLNPVLDELAEARPLDVMVFAEKYNLDMRNPEQRRQATEEMVARMAERLMERGLLTRMMDLARAWWADFTGEEYTDAQIRRDLLAPAAGFVAARQFSNMRDTSDVTRYREGTLPDPGNHRQVADPDVAANTTGKSDYRTAVGDMASAVRTSLMFTHSLIEKLERRLSAARDFRRAWDHQQRLGADWERLHQGLGQKYVKLSSKSAENVSKVLLHYSSTGKVPHLLKHGKKLTRTEEGIGEHRVHYNDLTDADLQIDNTEYAKLQPHEQEVVDMSLETMAELRMAETEMRLNQIRRSVAQMRAAGRQSPGELNAIEQKALDTIIGVHNRQIVSAYVPQTRRGDFRVVAKSAELLRAEQEALEHGDPINKIPLRNDANHYQYIGAESAAEAQADVAELRKQGWTFVDFHRQPQAEIEYGLDLSQLSRLYDRLAAAEREGEVQLALPRQVEQEMLQALNQMVEQGRSTIQSRMRRDNIAGVKTAHIMPNVLERTKDFGYYYAASMTAPARYEALLGMRQQLAQLSGQDNAEYTRTFDELMSRAHDVREGDLFGDKVARGLLKFSSVQYLLSNPSYYVLQLTQPWVLSAPVLVGEFGMGAVSRLAASYGQTKDIVSGMLKGEQELKFDRLPEHHRHLLRELQARNSLDVGMSQEYGVVHGSVASNAAAWAMRAMYNTARGVELVNRAATAVAAYDLRMEQLLKGRQESDLSPEQAAQLRDRAVDYADWAVFRTHGNYSFADAPKIFRNPIFRVMLQFKKIALIQAELIGDLWRRGITKHKLSARAVDFISNPTMGVDEGVLQKLRNNQWLTEDEFTALHQRVTEASRDPAVQRDMTEQDIDFFTQLLNAELHPDVFVTYEGAQAARAGLGWLVSSSAAITGTISVPFATAALARAARALDPGEDEDAFETDEGTVMRVFGPEVGSFVLRGAMGSAVGVDVSSRIGINFVDHMFGAVYENYRVADSDSGVKEALYGFAGPSVNYVGDFTKGLNYLQQYATTGSEHDLVKGLASMAPLGVRNNLSAHLWDKHGLVSDSRLKLIDEEDFSPAQIWGKRFGFQPSMVSEFYDIREHMGAVQTEAEKKRLLLKRSFYEASEAGDGTRLDHVREQWRELQDTQRQVGLPPSSASELQQFVRQKRREQARSVAGMPTTSRNRALAERLAAQHGYGAIRGMTAAQRAELLRQGVNPFVGS